jgi:hypothetical protein
MKYADSKGIRTMRPQSQNNIFLENGSKDLLLNFAILHIVLNVLLYNGTSFVIVLVIVILNILDSFVFVVRLIKFMTFRWN